MKRLSVVLGLVYLLAAATMAAPIIDVTGKWSGAFNITFPDGNTKNDEAYMDLKQTGEQLAGTAGPNTDQQWPISNGKVVGNKLTFEVQTDKPLIKFELMLVDGHLKGEAKGEHDGQTIKATLDLQRKP